MGLFSKPFGRKQKAYELTPKGEMFMKFLDEHSEEYDNFLDAINAFELVWNKMWGN